VPKKSRTFTSQKITLKLLHVPETWFVLKIQVFVKGFSCFLVEIQPFHARNRCLLAGVFYTPYLHGGLQIGFKDGGQVIVPDLLEFADSHA
jgi:hypothetical protein